MSHVIQKAGETILRKNMMTDFDAIWRTQDEIRTVVNAVLGECIWNLAYDERRRAIVLELTQSLDEDAISNLCSHFSTVASVLHSCRLRRTRTARDEIRVLYVIQLSSLRINHSNTKKRMPKHPLCCFY